MARGVWLAVVGLLGVSACVTAREVSPGRERPEVRLADEPDAMIQMRRNGCPDQPCPVYSISIFSDGTAIYEGRANVGVIGRRALKVRASDLCALITTLDAMDFLDVAEDCCACTDAEDASTVTVSYRPGSVGKTVIHDRRCAKAPAALSALERQIDRSAGADQLAVLPGRPALGSRRQASSDLGP